MAYRKPAVPAPGAGERARLEALARSGGRRGSRARIVLLAAAGRSNTAIAAELGLSKHTVGTWRERYLRCGLAGLADAPRPGAPHAGAGRAALDLRVAPAVAGGPHWRRPAGQPVPLAGSRR